MKKTLLLTAMAVLGCMLTFAQETTPNKNDYKNYPYWIEMMQDETVNFYDVQEAFNTYWEDREITRGCGYKPFKRWEYMMQWRIKPNGERLPADHLWKEYHNFMDNNPAAKSPSGDWECLGPFDVPSAKGYQGLGRLNAIAFHPTDPDIIFAGAPAGGLWFTHDGGITWESHCDVLPSLGVSSIAVDHSNPDVIYMGTGDRDAGDAAGIGILKSTDGGVTWAESSNGMGTKTVGRMIIHPTDASTLYAATSGGIYKTTDGGQNWVQKSSGNFKEIVFKVDDPDVLFASKSGGFYKSTDAGETWVQITNGLSSSERSVIAVTPDNPDVVYFLTSASSEFKALYRSTDAGESFAEMSNSPNIMSWGCNGGSGGQAWYDLDIAADPNDEFTIFAGGVNCFKSTDGGQTWNISSHWWGDCGVPAVHADLHILEYNPINDRLYAGNDGGIYWTGNGGAAWTLITDGMAISQVYRIGQSATVKDLVINGYQDNGTSTYDGTGWDFTRGGDGFECIIDHTESEYSYATVYYGSIARYYNNNYQMVVAEDGAYGINESGAWITPYIMDEYDANVMFVGYKNIWRCNNVKASSGQISWKKISDWGTDNMAVVEQSPANTDILYCGNYSGDVWRTDDASASAPQWYNISGYVPGSSTVGDIEAHPFEEDVVYVAVGSSIHKSEDRGITWTDISYDLPNVNYTSIAFYKNSLEGLYVSSDLGVFYKEEGMTSWVWFNQGLPVDASIREIEIYYHPDSIAGDVIRAGTYGRGLWSSDMWAGSPSAAFTSSSTLIPPNCTVDFYNTSTGVPHFFEWTFEGATPASSTEKDPAGINYDSPGTYAVALKVWNENGDDSVYMEAYITVSDEILPDVDFTADATMPCGNDVINFTDLTLNCPVSWQWSFEPDDVSFVNGTTSTSQNPKVKFNSSGTYNVTLAAENSNGQSTLTKSDYITIGGITLPYVEDFEDGTLNDKGWTVENPDMGITWALTEVEGNSPGNMAVWMNFFDYYAYGPRDYLISPAMDFSSMNTVGLFFQHAYAYRYSLADTLIVKISTDCGETWTRLWEAGLDDLATAPENTEFFAPQTADDWCGSGPGVACTFIDLSAYAQEMSVKIMFETFGRFNNNLYLDNIEVGEAVGVSNNMLEEEKIVIFPNPSDDVFNIMLPARNESLLMSVRDVKGQLIHEEQIAKDKALAVYNASSLPQGVYMISFVSNEINVIEKIIVR